MREKILEKVGAFPPLDDTVNKVMAVCNNPDSSIMELTKVVESDPMLTANILKSANSPIYGFSREIKNISQAISIFGMETIKGFAFSSFLQKKPDLNLTPYNLSAKQFSEISQKQNAFISKWYRGRKSFLDILSLTSFLMEIGKIILANIVIEHKKVNEFREEVKKCQNLEQLYNLEIDVFGISNEEVAAMILEEWNFVPEMYNSIKYINTPENANEEIQKYAASLKAVKSIITTSNFNKEESLEISLSIIKKFNLEEEKFINVYESFFEMEGV